MYVYIYIYIYMCMDMCVCVCVHIYVWMNEWMSVYIYIYIYIYICICMHVCVCLFAYIYESIKYYIHMQHKITKIHVQSINPSSDDDSEAKASLLKRPSWLFPTHQKNYLNTYIIYIYTPVCLLIYACVCVSTYVC